MPALRADMHGVLVLMWGATVPLVYYAFPGHADHGRLLRASYWTLTTVLAAACQAATVFPPCSAGPPSATGAPPCSSPFAVASFVLPIQHGWLLGAASDGGGGFASRVAVGWVALTGLPERPGRPWPTPRRY